MIREHNKKEVAVRPLSLDDYKSAISVRDEVVSDLSDPSLFIPPGDDYLASLLAGEGISVGAFQNGRLLGFLSIWRPSREASFGPLLSLSEGDLNFVWHLEHSLVLEDYRGKGIFSIMYRHARELAGPRMRFCLKTIAPHNSSSLAAALANGFEVVSRIKAYGGFD